MLDLDVTKAVETLLGGITRKKSKRIEESKWRLGTKFILKGVVKSGRGDGLLGRSESSGGGDKGGKDGGLHVDKCFKRKIMRLEWSQTVGSFFVSCVTTLRMYDGIGIQEDLPQLDTWKIPSRLM